MDEEDVVYMYIYMHIHTHMCTHTCDGILHGHKKNETVPFAAKWMDLEFIILNVLSQRKANIIWNHSYVESKK